MGIVLASVSRSEWWFGQQCVPGGVTVDAGGIGAPRYSTLLLPRCVAVAIAPESEVRAVRISEPGQSFARMTRLYEGAPQIFDQPGADGAPVDLARLDWTDGRLVLECAETPEDVAGLSVAIASQAVVTIQAEAPPFDVLIQPPRVSNGVMIANGNATRSGGAGGVPVTVTQNVLRSDGLATLLVNVPGNLMVSVAATITNGVAVSLATSNARDPIRVLNAADVGASLNLRVFVRGA